MLIRILVVAERAPVEFSADALPADDVVMEYRRPADFWTDPGSRPFDLAFVYRQDLPSEAETALARIRSLHQRPEVVVLGVDLDDRETLTLQAAGCFAVVPLGLSEDQLTKTLIKLVSRRRDALAVAVRAQQAPKPLRMGDLVSESPAIREILRIAGRVAVSDTSLLLLGETGAGKEWLARAVHAESTRAAGPFIAVNCGAIPENLLESELFGHEKGSFTGAIRTRRGYFEQAHTGTIFLDEIGEMPSSLQVRLLRVLQDRTIQRLGGEESIEIDSRVIAATHRDPKEAMESGRLRQDLYYRLAVVTLTVPSLRDRVEDIRSLAELYLDRFTRQLARTEVTTFTPAAMGAIQAYAWPGNVRELINVVERAVLLCDSNAVDLVDLPVEIAGAAATEILEQEEDSPIDDIEAWLEQPVEVGRLAVVTDFEKRYFSRLLERNRGHIGKTAEKAGVDPRTLYNKMRQLGLEKADFKQ